MIRDPSDGSVRENQPKPLGTNNIGPEEPVLGITTSGLQTGSEKPENLARLEKSREWLENYRKERK